MVADVWRRFFAKPKGPGCRRVAKLLFLALACLASTAAAEENPWRQWAGLAAQSDSVVHGTCTSASSAWDDSGRFIVTTVRVRTHRSFKGAEEGPVTVKVLGGTVGGVRMQASHGAKLAEGEEAVLFLQRSRFGPYYVVAGGEAGKVAVRGSGADGAPAVLGSLAMDEFARGLRLGGGRP